MRSKLHGKCCLATQYLFQNGAEKKLLAGTLHYLIMRDTERLPTEMPEIWSFQFILSDARIGWLIWADLPCFHLRHFSSQQALNSRARSKHFATWGKSPADALLPFYVKNSELATGQHLPPHLRAQLCPPTLPSTISSPGIWHLRMWDIYNAVRPTVARDRSWSSQFSCMFARENPLKDSPTVPCQGKGVATYIVLTYLDTTSPLSLPTSSSSKKRWEPLLNLTYGSDPILS